MYERTEFVMQRGKGDGGKLVLLPLFIALLRQEKREDFFFKDMDWNSV